MISAIQSRMPSIIAVAGASAYMWGNIYLDRKPPSDAYKEYLEKYKPIPGQLMVASVKFQANRAV
ncbi:hypothetical protein PsYK624_037870 [Phanerochaete sordida]|uniref:Uncharacterized protein n=1 Tax=Phanerochaete sordida TaxID=48140 RepID=A0A9P3G4I2_9APHY|nr:hypothetical protein PsYK624_037870 [Phanerochaete sordida]